MNIIKNQCFDEERALYNLTDAKVENCNFEGPRDGESAFKEARNITVENCSFSLRYPFWHTHDFVISNCNMNDKTRAAIWYAVNGRIEKSNLGGIKAVRECDGITLADTKVNSMEFGWRSKNIKIDNCEMTSEYFLFECKNVEINNLKMQGKYSFQYIENMNITNSNLDTKDAFWHAKNVRVENSVVKGEYLGWYSDGLTLVNCKIIGTQPLCYCRNLTLIDCEMIDTDLSFEYSDVNATVKGEIMSVKNPHSGKIKADKIGELIMENSIMENSCIIEAEIK